MGRRRSLHLPLSVVLLKESQDVVRDPAQTRAVATIVKTDATVTKTELTVTKKDLRERMTTIGTVILTESALTVGQVNETVWTVGVVIETVGIVVAVIGTAAGMNVLDVMAMTTKTAKGEIPVIGPQDASIVAGLAIVKRNKCQ